MEEVTELLRTMENYVTKVKQGHFSHSSLGPTPRAQNHPIQKKPPFKRPLNGIQRESRLEEQESPRASKS
uniref:Uncharacterized protein n=1 Tax=Picea sitchensis TaxID=3332 RepID=A0A6B9XQ45_PICSI|nr:hypothetical protein Q903MT_gene4167 [Picea sitchensis]